jgi:hypothetical protein
MLLSGQLEPQTAPYMPIVITPEVGIPLPFDVTPEEAEGFRERAKAACQTILDLIQNGADVKADEEDSAKAHQIIATEKFTPAKTPPGTILKLEALLDHYDHEFLEANRRIQNLVTNKLLEETENEDPKIRMRALELLGKRKGVQLFTDQIEITIKQKPIDEIEKELGSLLERYMGPVEQAVKDDVEDVEETVDAGNVIPDEDELDAMLGLKKGGADGEQPPADAPSQ